MEALSGWLERIILLVLLATLLDLTLPNNSFQRYVKLVMGLMIILAILTPVMSIFQKDFSPEKMALKIMNLNQQSDNGELLKIKQDGEKIMRENSLDTQKYVKDQLESLMKAQLEEKFGVTVHSLQVVIDKKEMDKEKAYPVISTVHIILDKDMKEAGEKASAQKSKIEPIQPVTIHIGGKSSESAPAVSTPSTLPSEQNKLLTDIIHFVAQTWSIDQTRVIATLQKQNEEGKG